MKTDAKIAISKLFEPRSIAVVGASSNPKSLGSRTLKLIKEYGYSGSLYAVNPRGQSSCGVNGYRKVVEIQDPIDLCLIVVPATAVEGVIEDSVLKQIPVAQILTGGFGESGATGLNYEHQILQKAGGITRLVGPNCIGVHSTVGRLTFVSSADNTPGKVAVASQSGGLSVDMVLQAKTRGLALGKLVSMGNCLDLDPVDFLNFFSDDPDTEVIGLYLEGIKRGKEFLNTLRKASNQKPVVILKGGRTSLGAKSVASHTNSLAGEYIIWRAAISQAGAILVDNIDELLSTLTALQSFVPLPQGEGIALVGNGGGATVLATDLLEERGLTLATPTQNTKTAISGIDMPPGSTVGNPTDTPVNALNKSGGEALGEVVKCLLKDSTVYGVVFHINLVPFINYDNRLEIVEGILFAISTMYEHKKPIYLGIRSVCNPLIEELRIKILEAARRTCLPCFQSANEAVSALALVRKWTQRPTYNFDVEATTLPLKSLEEIRKLSKLIRKEGYRSIPQDLAFYLLNLFGIPHPPFGLAKSASEAAKIANEIGFPVALKIDSPDIIHKSDVGGVRTSLRSEADVTMAFDEIMSSVAKKQEAARIRGILVQAMSSEPLQELICGLKKDAVFGHVLLLGIGGVTVEIKKGFTVRVLPIAKGESQLMWQEVPGFSLLNGYRGRERADTNALEDLLQRVAVMAEFFPEISEMDLNPVMIMKEGHGLYVVDCRIIFDN